MREKRNFAKRTKVLPTSEARKKYFIVCEGEETEQIYFEAVNDYRNNIGINPLIELVPIIRSYSEIGWSNPKKILDRILQNLKETDSGKVSYETLLNWIMDYLYEAKILTTSRVMARRIWAVLESTCNEKISASLSDDIEDLESACAVLIRALEEQAIITKVVDDISNDVKKYAFTYDAELDKICFIIDRDRDSFVSNQDNDQYGYVLEKCRANGFGFYLSNPNFEFWLLLHYDEVLNLDMQQLLDNPKVTTSKRYTEQQLRILLPGFTKSKYRAEELMPRIGKAILNEKKFCENEAQLEYSVGSRVGLLIEEMQQQNNI